MSPTAPPAGGARRRALNRDEVSGLGSTLNRKLRFDSGPAPNRALRSGLVGQALLAVAVGVVLAVVSGAPAEAKVKLHPKRWKAMPELPMAISHHRAVVTDKALVVVGGRDRYGKPLRQVVRAQLKGNGSYTKWVKGKELPRPLSNHSAGIVNGVLYVCGGMEEGAQGEKESDAVWAARVSSNGSVSAWKPGKRLPDSVHAHAQVGYRHWVYIVGGMSGGTYRRDVLMADAGNGQIESWTPILSLPTPLAYAAALVVDKYLVVIGGQSTGTGKSLTMATVFVGPISPDGTISTWYLASSKLPGAWLGFGRSQTSACVYKNTLFCFGGQDALWFLVEQIASAPFNVKRGAIGSWGLTEGAKDMPQLTSAVVWDKHVYLIGGTSQGKVSGGVLRGTFTGKGK